MTTTWNKHRSLFLIVSVLSCTHGNQEVRDIASAKISSESVFESKCLQLSKSQGFKSDVCSGLKNKFFSKIDPQKSLADLDPKDVGAPALAADKNIRIIVFNDELGAAALSYCYYLNKGVFDSSIGPIELSKASSGFTITKESVAAYMDWVENTDAGKQCKKRVELETGYAHPNLENEFKGKSAIVAAVPLAAIYSGFTTQKTIETELKLSVNHGRILAYVQACPDLQAWGQRQWLSLSDKERKVISSSLSAYKWDDVTNAGRQYTAFTFEKNPTKILSLAKTCQW